MITTKDIASAIKHVQEQKGDFSSLIDRLQSETTETKKVVPINGIKKTNQLITALEKSLY